MIARAEVTLRMYKGMLNRPQSVDWLFDIIDPSETDEAYLNRQAEKMLAAGVTRVVLNNQEWRI